MNKDQKGCLSTTQQTFEWEDYLEKKYLQIEEMNYIWMNPN